MREASSSCSSDITIPPTGLAYASGRLLDWAGKDVAYAHLRGLDLAGAQLQGCNFRGADLRGACLRGVDARGAVFDEADLRAADCTEALLQGASFRRARLDGASFRQALLLSVHFEQASLRGTDCSNAQCEWAWCDGVDWQETVVVCAWFLNARGLSTAACDTIERRGGFTGVRAMILGRELYETPQ
jgi:uncharacterized protein YjbI with pentapeptide repeats